MTDKFARADHSLMPLPRLRRSPFVAAVGFLLATALVWAQGSDNRNRQTAPSQQATGNDKTASPKTNYRIREGTEIVAKLGQFRRAGQRLTFFADAGKSRFVGLENLNLERIARAIADSPAALDWKVSGTVTEFAGANYLLVERAVLTSPSGSPKRGSRQRADRPEVGRQQ